MNAFARRMVVAAAGMLGAAASASAHHAVQAVFDVNKTITVSGSITKVEWINPHSYISLDAKDEKSTSLMSGGFEVLRQHHITLWEVLAEMTKDDIPERHWKV